MELSIMSADTRPRPGPEDDVVTTLGTLGSATTTGRWTKVEVVAIPRDGAELVERLRVRVSFGRPHGTPFLIAMPAAIATELAALLVAASDEVKRANGPARGRR